MWGHTRAHTGIFPLQQKRHTRALVAPHSPITQPTNQNQSPNITADLQQCRLCSRFRLVEQGEGGRFVRHELREGEQEEGEQAKEPHRHDPDPPVLQQHEYLRHQVGHVVLELAAREAPPASRSVPFRFIQSRRPISSRPVPSRHAPRACVSRGV